MAIAEGLRATKAGFDLVKGALELVKREDIDRSEVLARLLELQGLLLDARTALSDADAEKKQLEAKISELVRMADIGKDFKSAHGVYWYLSNPYCPTCWDVDRKPVRLAGPVRTGATGHGEHNQWTCPFHKSVFLTYWSDQPPTD